jgi:uncharacterized protein
VTQRDDSDAFRAGDPSAIDRRSFLFGTVAAIFEPPFLPEPPPLPERRRIRVAVLGDSVAEDLFFGLREITPKTAHYIFIQHGKASTGLTQPSFFDWPAKARSLAEENWGAAIVLLGLNDNLPIKLDQKWAESGTPQWRNIYGARAVDMMRSFVERGIPLVWIGPPCVRSQKMDRGMLAIHEVLAANVPPAGGIFLSSRDFTIGPDREFSASLAASDGRLVQMRHSDGVHFTGAGNRYLAEHVIRALRAEPKTAPIFS